MAGFSHHFKIWKKYFLLNVKEIFLPFIILSDLVKKKLLVNNPQSFFLLKYCPYKNQLLQRRSFITDFK